MLPGRIFPSIAIGIMSASLSSAAGLANSCDRRCLGSLADAMLDSMVSHAALTVPLTPEYSATEEGQPAALPMMTLWRTVSGIKNKFYVVDPQSEQLFFIATAAEGSHESLIYGRLKAEAGRLSELELYTNRSRANGGFQFDAKGPANFPAAWTNPIAATQRASRADLLRAGQSIFDTSVEGPPPGAACVLMENGKIVGEDPSVLKSIMAGKVDVSKLPRNADGTVQIPCGTSPDRPTDKHARTDLIDEQQGIVISLGVVDGIVEPYLVTNPTDSAFVPNSMLASYTDMLKQQKLAGNYHSPAVKPLPASVTVMQLHRIYDGKLQGMMMLQNMAPMGAISPWNLR